MAPPPLKFARNDEEMVVWKDSEGYYFQKMFSPSLAGNRKFTTLTVLNGESELIRIEKKRYDLQGAKVELRETLEVKGEKHVLRVARQAENDHPSQAEPETRNERTYVFKLKKFGNDGDGKSMRVGLETEENRYFFDPKNVERSTLSPSLKNIGPQAEETHYRTLLFYYQGVFPPPVDWTGYAKELAEEISIRKPSIAAVRAAKRFLSETGGN